MADRQTREELIATGEVVGAPVQRACTDQSFEFPNGIYAAMVFMFAAFIGVLGLAFRGGHMAVIVAVIFAFIAAFFAIPAIFPGVAARTRTSSARSWLDSISAALGVLGWDVLPCPKVDRLDPDLRADLEAVAAKHGLKALPHRELVATCVAFDHPGARHMDARARLSGPGQRLAA